jgi:mRNA interferase MazF
MKKGEIWIVEFPLTNGHEQTGLRPVIVLADTDSNICIIIPLTSNIQALRFPHTLEIEPTKQNGLLAKSVALVFQIRAIDKKRFKKKAGDLESVSMNKIDKMLKKLLQM